MTRLILYIAESTLYLSAFYIFFILTMRKTTFFRFNRMAFISGTILCILLPLLNIQMPEWTYGETTMNMIRESINDSTLSAAGEPAEDMGVLSLIRSINIIFIAGALTSLALTLRSYWLMIKMIHSIPGTKISNTNVKVTEADIPSFSWLKNIVISRHDLEENPAILKHEKMHVRCRHSIDLMAFTVITTLHWFNPVIWIARKELKMLHEYEADGLTLEMDADPTQYQLLLVRKAVGEKHFQLANGFNHSRLKNRIGMLHRKRSNRFLKITYLLFIPVLSGMMWLCSSPDVKAKKIQKITVTIGSEGDKPEAVLKDFTLEQLDSAIDNSRVEPVWLTVQLALEEGYYEDLNTVKEHLRRREVLKMNHAKEKTDNNK